MTGLMARTMTQFMDGPMLTFLATALPLALAAVLGGLYWFERRDRRVEQEDASFYSLADVAPAGIWRTDANGRCLYVNKAWEKVTGITDWEGDGWAAALHPDDAERVRNRLMSAIAREEQFEAEWRWLRQDGSVVWVTGLGGPEFDDDGDLVAYVGINIDIQQSKDLERDLKESRKRAEHAAAAKTSFLANMSHEIRTPMNGVIGFTELLMESDLDEDQRTQVQMIADSGRAMMHLLNDILDHSKIECGQLRIQSEPVELRHKLEHCLKLMEPMARAKGLSLGVWVDDGVPQFVSTDRLRLRQVLLNLVGNAVKFTDTGGIDVEARVENSTEGRSLLITVIDTGIGIEEEKLEAIFSPFTQEDATVARKYGGTGLGLAISSQLVGMMGGRITVHSKPGVGTQFTIRLPLTAAQAPTALPVAAPISQGNEPGSLEGARVLIAEDHAINQQLIMAMAGSLKLEASLVADGKEAVSAVVEAAERNRPFDAVLMDMQMPGMDGLEATRRLRALGYDAQSLPIIALTANCYPDDVAACEEAGMQSHLGKPVTTVALARELARWLDVENGSAPAEEDFAADPAGTGPAGLAGLQDRYRDRKTEIVADLRVSLETGGRHADFGRLADELHKLAGVAANFGEPELGEASRRLERRLKTSDAPDDFLAALKREWPIFEKAA